MKTGGIILCGGESKRMGAPKAWLSIGGEPMLQRVVTTVRQTVAPVVVVAAAGQALPDLPADVRIIRDDEPGRGPVQGLAGGLAAMRGLADAAFVSGCDTPFLTPAFIARMVELVGPVAACVPFVDGRHYPLAAVYRVEVVDVVEQMLREDVLRLGALLERVPARLVAEDELTDIDPHLASLRNLNTPDDYERVVGQANQ